MGGNAKWRSRVVWTKDTNGKKVPLRDSNGKIVKIGVRQYNKNEKEQLKEIQRQRRSEGFARMTKSSTPDEKTFRDKVNGASSKEDLVNVMRGKYGTGFNERFVTANNLNNVKRAMDTVSELEDRFPFMKGFIKSFNIRKDAIAAMSQSGELTLNPRYWNLENNPAFSDYGGGFNHKNPTLESTIAHEFGHAVHNWLWDRMVEANPPKSFLDQINQMKTRRSGKFLNDVVARAKKIAHVRSKDALFSQISKYATYSNQEGFAEAFADVFANGDNATVASKALYQAMSEELQKYGVGL